VKQKKGSNDGKACKYFQISLFKYSLTFITTKDFSLVNFFH